MKVKTNSTFSLVMKESVHDGHTHLRTKELWPYLGQKPKPGTKSFCLKKKNTVKIKTRRCEIAALHFDSLNPASLYLV